MSTPRAVRIPRGTRDATTRLVRAPREVVAPPALRAELPRANRAGTQRVARLTVVYLVLLGILYAGFVLYGRTAPGGTSSGTESTFAEFGLLALALALVGTFLTLSPAPRAVERLPDGFVIVGRWGRRTPWTPLARVSVRLVRRYPPGFLSGEAVDLVEVSATGKRSKGYLIESGLLPETPTGRTSW